LKYRDFVRILTDRGFVCVRQNGSHRQFEGWVDGIRHAVTVSGHRESDDILPKTFASMVRQSGLPKSLFR